MSARIILLNGPPRCGKDTVARTFCRMPGNFAHDKLSLPIKRAFAGLMNVPVHDDLNVYPYEDMKEQVIPVLGVSYRAWQIDFAENFMRAKYGKDVFIRLLIERLAPYRMIRSITNVIVSDCGFQLEADLLETEGFDVRVIQIRRDGCDYRNDSREYVTGKRTTVVQNDGTILDLTDKVLSAIKEG